MVGFLGKHKKFLCVEKNLFVRICVVECANLLQLDCSSITMSLVTNLVRVVVTSPEELSPKISACLLGDVVL